MGRERIVNEQLEAFIITFRDCNVSRCSELSHGYIKVTKFRDPLEYAISRRFGGKIISIFVRVASWRCEEEEEKNDDDYCCKELRVEPKKI
jgi:hypothetical protein